MDVLAKLPDVLQRFQLDYMSIPELIESGIELTASRLRELVKNTLGQAVLDGSIDKLYDLVEEPISDAGGDGITALLLLDRLPPELITNDMMLYFARQSLVFKRVVYPVMLRVLSELPEDVYADMLSELGVIESGLFELNSGLELIYNLVGPEFLVHVDLNALAYVNLQFLVNHLDKLPVTVNMILITVKTGNDAITKVLVSRLFTAGNRALQKYFGLSMSNFEQVIILHQIPEIYAFIQPELQRQGIDIEQEED